MINDNEMAREQYREAVWNSLLQYESLQRYYRYVSEKFSRQGKYLTVAVLTSASGSALVLLAGWPVFGKVVAVVVAALSIWLALTDYSNLATISVSLAVELGHASREMYALWMKVDDLSDEDVEEQWAEIDKRATDITRWVPNGLLGFEEIQDKAEHEAYAYWSQGAGAPTVQS